MTGTDANGVAGHAPSKPLNELFCNLPTTIFEVMSKLAMEHNSVNLGQGFPDEEGPASMKEVAGQALTQFHNQYPSMLGVPELRQAVARHSANHAGIPCDWATETLVTVGATEGIAACMLGLINEGDEVIMFDPMYDSYVSMARRAGAVIKPVRLALPDFHVPLEELAAAFSPRTKLIMVNTPHNPSGKVFTRAELEAIAALCIQHDVIAVCDEVYEHLVFGGAQHVSLRSLPGMAERSVRLGSAGKTFSFTAWKVGWVTGPARLLAPIIKAHSFLVFTVSSSLQRGVAHGLDHESSFYLGLGPSLSKKRALLAPHLAELGFGILPGHGAYFLVADVSRFLRPGEDDAAFCMRLTREGGVTLIPISGFYIGPNPPRHLVRFAYCKDDAKLLAAVERLEKYLGPGGPGAPSKA
uniref:Aminotransferase class I/classII large domain-containing protein n=1 Tax=Chlamydomonas leiostraca TaxID=1034604 RepID=A0A7S0RQZ7_9CHLO|eukprot:CAMPEP_0202859204 /NCGR_PEP_ID=MMETSP1391-20130828/1425_1 /ASSEMBLY_ACC=CAM_ASM_000867 /TAXON_ID=1034604 /ORGANISM="Chlamydomonas leiostraca, Strain SAG 11-49" /LENGTH=411 /DNA_ID=CAMNT_0049538219 /DNA_START=68 /DNA_END=1303 /DNA_ORIENTATION=-